MRTWLAVAIALVPAVALAQPPPDEASTEGPAPDPAASDPAAMAPVAPVQPAQLPRERRGLFGGFGLFGGNISCDGMNCGGFREAGGASGHLGWMFGPRLGVLLDVWAMTSSQSNVSVTFATSTVNLRYYLAPTFWVQGGVGNGHAVVRVSVFSGRSDDVPVGQVAAGLELVRGRSWALDVSLKIAQGRETARGGDANDDTVTGRSVGLGAHLTFFTHKPSRTTQP